MFGGRLLLTIVTVFGSGGGVASTSAVVSTIGARPGHSHWAATGSYGGVAAVAAAVAGRTSCTLTPIRTTVVMVMVMMMRAVMVMKNGGGSRPRAGGDHDVGTR